jgi:hypothetical protein
MTLAANEHFRPFFDALADIGLDPVVLFLCHHRSDGGLWIARITGWKGANSFLNGPFDSV